jgi:hypothetical protein
MNFEIGHITSSVIFVVLVHPVRRTIVLAVVEVVVPDVLDVAIAGLAAGRTFVSHHVESSERNFRRPSRISTSVRMSEEFEVCPTSSERRVTFDLRNDILEFGRTREETESTPCPFLEFDPFVVRETPGFQFLDIFVRLERRQFVLKDGAERIEPLGQVHGQLLQ